MVPVALRAGHPVVIVNAEPTPFDAEAAAVVRGSVSEVLPPLVAGRARPASVGSGVWRNSRPGW